MTARTVSADDPGFTEPMFGAPVDPAIKSKPETSKSKPDANVMMAGADMYRRMQAPKKAGSASAYLIGGVAAIALIGGGVYFAFAGQQGPAKPTPVAQAAATNAANANQQAQAANAQAQAAQQSAQANADTAQANKVAETGNPPPVATDTTHARKPTRVVTRTHEAVVHHTVVARQTQPTSSATSSGVNASAYTPAPPPVTAVQPTPAVPAPAPAPVVVPAPAPAPAPSQVQPQPTTPPQ